MNEEIITFELAKIAESKGLVNVFAKGYNYLLYENTEEESVIFCTSKDMIPPGSNWVEKNFNYILSAN